jgi:agmatinase
MRICWANTDNFDDSDVVIFGIPDESKSHSLRKGSSEAPHKIREISNIRDTYKRGNEVSRGFPLEGINCKVYDHGNVLRTDVYSTVDKIISRIKTSIAIGGDHSISAEIIRSISKRCGPVSLVYFDAHPDFISSSSGYYGSVLSDVLPYIDLRSSVQIGIRTPEQEEINNIKKHDLSVITPIDVLKSGITKIESDVLNRLGPNVYVSVDMDAIDPAYAPGVSVPVPLGLESREVLYLLKSITKKGITGLDVMEVCPSYDIKDRTSHLASRIIGEVISSIDKTS